MSEPIHVQLLRKNVEKNYIYIAYYGKDYTTGSNDSLDLKDFEEKTGIVWSAKRADYLVDDYDETAYTPELVMSRELFLSITRGI